MLPFNETIDFTRRNMRVLKERKNPLFTFGPTKLPYLCLTAVGDDTLIRAGEVVSDKPKIVIPGRDFEFSGFDDEDTDGGLPVLIARGVKMPTASYTNKEQPARRVSDNLAAAAAREIARLNDANDTRTGVICAPEQVWRLSLLLYVGQQIARSSESNLAEHLERLRLAE
ncbi:MAG: hypothetical protein LBP75_03420 [Planctomycetota bacterium]|jgi:hypothetical protein|nr:hypothetical protein [Planctomycetota bacterium]